MPTEPVEGFYRGARRSAPGRPRTGDRGPTVTARAQPRGPPRQRPHPDRARARDRRDVRRDRPRPSPRPWTPPTSGSRSPSTSCRPICRAPSSSNGARAVSRSGRARSSPICGSPTRSTPAEVRNALFEAIQEGRVAIGGELRPLPGPSLVLTGRQNPPAYEGTHPLPEARLDRFMLELLVDSPGPEEELAILAGTAPNRPRIEVSPVATTDAVLAGRVAVDRDHLDPRLAHHLVDLVYANPGSHRLRPRARSADRGRRLTARHDLPRARRLDARLRPLPWPPHSARRRVGRPRRAAAPLARGSGGRGCSAPDHRRGYVADGPARRAVRTSPAEGSRLAGRATAAGPGPGSAPAFRVSFPVPTRSSGRPDGSRRATHAGRPRSTPPPRNTTRRPSASRRADPRPRSTGRARSTRTYPPARQLDRPAPRSATTARSSRRTPRTSMHASIWGSPGSRCAAASGGRPRRSATGCPRIGSPLVAAGRSRTSSRTGPATGHPPRAAAEVMARLLEQLRQDQARRTELRRSGLEAPGERRCERLLVRREYGRAGGGRGPKAPDPRAAAGRRSARPHHLGVFEGSGVGFAEVRE